MNQAIEPSGAELPPHAHHLTIIGEGVQHYRPRDMREYAEDYARAAIASRDSVIAERDREIAELREKIRALGGMP